MAINVEINGCIVDLLREDKVQQSHKIYAQLENSSILGKTTRM